MSNSDFGRQPVRYGMVGGGPGGFIGQVHRRAAAMDGLIALVAGSFSSDSGRNRAMGAELGLPGDRVYDRYEEMFQSEARLPPDDRIEFVAIVTPNHLHAPIAQAALRHRIPVLCEKPVALDLAEARTLKAAADASGAAFGVTYTYLGYPLVHEARALVAAGRIGKVRRVTVSYTQGWLSRPVEHEGNRQAAWRTAPEFAGIGGALGDIGVHAQSLAEFVSGLSIAEVCADVGASVAGRALDDDAAVLLRMANGARGTLVASQICAGDENRLEVRIHGETGGLEWRQESPNELWLTAASGPAQRITTNAGMMTDPRASSLLRLPGGHPEGYIEAFANLYRAFALTLRGGADQPAAIPIPGIAQGVRSMAFIEAVKSSSDANGAWRPIAG